MDKLKLFVRSKVFIRSLVIVSGLGLACLIFLAGISVGERKASFEYRWGETYHRNFGGPRAGFVPGVPPEDFVNRHGAFGRVLSVDLPQMIIESPEGLEKTVIVGTGTTIMKFRDRLLPENIIPNDSAVIIGSPNGDSQIEARLIRIIPRIRGETSSFPFQNQ